MHRIEMSTGPATIDGAEMHRRDQALKSVCVEFESMLLAEMFKSMRRETAEGGLVPKGQGEQLFQDMLDGEHARTVSRMNPQGLAATLYRQMRDLIPAGDTPVAVPDWVRDDADINF